MSFTALTRAAALASCALSVVGVAACTSSSDADRLVSAYLRHWSHGDLLSASDLTDNPRAAEHGLKAQQQDVSATAVRARPGRITVGRQQGTATYTATWTIRGLAKPWT